jgi:hypothetical protein
MTETLTHKQNNLINSTVPTNFWSRIAARVSAKTSDAWKKLSETAKKIWNAIKKFFREGYYNTLCFFRIKKPMPPCSAIAKRPQTTNPKPLRSRQFSTHGSEDNIVDLVERVKPSSKNESEKPRRKDPDLEKLRKTIQGFVQNSVEITLEETIREKKEKIEQGFAGLITLLNVSKEFLGRIIYFGETSSEVITTEIMKHFKVKEEKEEEKKSHFSDFSTQLLNLLIKNSKFNLSGMKCEGSTEKYYEAVLDWIFDAKRDKNVIETCAKKNLHDKGIVNAVLSKLLSALLQEKITEFEKKFKDYSKHYPDRIKRLAIALSEKITDKLSSRFSEIIYQKELFKKIFEQVLKSLNSHLNSHISAEKTVKELNLKSTAEESLRIYQKQFKDTEGCHPVAKEIVSNPNSQGKIETIVYEDVVKNVMQIILPNNGSDDGIYQLLSEADISAVIADELKYISEDFGALYSIIANSSSPVAKTFVSGFNFLKTLIVGPVKEVVKENIFKIVKGVFERLTEPAKLDQFLTCIALPPLKELLAAQIFKSELEKVIKENKEKKVIDVDSHINRLRDLKKVQAQIEKTARQNEWGTKEAELLKKDLLQTKEELDKIHLKLGEPFKEDLLNHFQSNQPRESIRLKKFQQIEKTILKVKENPLSEGVKETLEMIAKELYCDYFDPENLNNGPLLSNYLDELLEDITQRKKIESETMNLLEGVHFAIGHQIQSIKIVKRAAESCKQFNIEEEFGSKPLDLQRIILDLVIPYENEGGNGEKPEEEKTKEETEKKLIENILNSLIFSIGKFECKVLNIDCKPLLESLVLPPLADLILTFQEENLRDHKWMVTIFINILSDYSEKEGVRELLLKKEQTNEELEKSTKELTSKIEKQRGSEIKKISEICFEIISRVADPLPWYQRYPIQTGISLGLGDEMPLDKLIKECYQQLILKAKPINQSMLLHIKEIVIKALKDSAKNIDDINWLEKEIKPVEHDL